MSKYYVYIIKSLRDSKYYIGQTKDLNKRLIEHNQGKVRSTKSHAPYELIYIEEFQTRTEAIMRERFLKSAKGWSILKFIKSTSRGFFQRNRFATRRDHFVTNPAVPTKSLPILEAFFIIKRYLPGVQMSKYYVYIIKSLRDSKYYIGQTKDLNKRLIEHNQGKVRSTKSHAPYELIYIEEFYTRTEAIKRERFLKSAKGWSILKFIKSTSRGFFQRNRFATRRDHFVTNPVYPLGAVPTKSLPIMEAFFIF